MYCYDLTSDEYIQIIYQRTRLQEYSFHPWRNHFPSILISDPFKVDKRRFIYLEAVSTLKIGRFKRKLSLLHLQDLQEVIKNIFDNDRKMRFTAVYMSL